MWLAGLFVSVKYFRVLSEVSTNSCKNITLHDTCHFKLGAVSISCLLTFCLFSLFAAQPSAAEFLL